MSGPDLEAIERAALADAAAAATLAELEEARVAHTGRRSPLAGVLAGIGALPPEERGPVGRAANSARGAVEAALTARQGTLEADELGAALEPTPPTSRCRATRTRAARCTRSPRSGARWRTSSSASATSSPRARGRDRVAQLHGPQHAEGHPARVERHLLRRRAPGPAAAHPDLAGAGAGMQGSRRRSTSSRRASSTAATTWTPPQPDVPPDGGPGGGRGPDHGPPQGHDAPLRPRAARHGAGDPAAAALLPVHRAVGGRRRCRTSTSGARSWWLELLGAGDGRPERARGLRHRRRALHRLRLRLRPRPDRHDPLRRPRPAAASSRATCASWSSSREGAPVGGCASTSTPACPRRAGRAAARERDAGRGGPPPRRARGQRQPGRLPGRAGAAAEPAPERRPPARLPGRPRATASPAPSSAARPTWPAGQTVAVALPGALLPGGRPAARGGQAAGASRAAG